MFAWHNISLIQKIYKEKQCEISSNKHKLFNAITKEVGVGENNDKL
jgi:hypothetical protein